VTVADDVHHDADYRFEDLIHAEQWHFWFRARRDLVLWALDKYVPEAQRVLEVGCGAGYVLSEMRRRYPMRQIAACDASIEAIRHARERVSAAHLFQADARRLPVRRPFDVIAALDVIEHITEDTEALAEMFRTLTPGGSLVLTVPQHRWLWGRVDEFSCHRRRYERRELLEKVRAAGFEIVRCTSYFASTLPMLIASRLFAREDGPFDPTAELRISKTANAVLGALLQPESWIVKTGVSLPIGSTLVLVGRRPRS
jgi:SAM-dependent methyltransferase